MAKTRKRIGWGAVVIGALLGIRNLPNPHPWEIIVGACILGFALAMLLWDWAFSSSITAGKFARPFFSLVLCIAVAGIWGWYCWPPQPPSAPVPAPKPVPSLAMQCDMDFMPIQIPPGGRVALFLLHVNPEFTEQVNNTSRYSKWPLNEQAKIPKNEPLVIEKCEVASLSEPVEGVAIPLSLHIGKKEWTTNVQFPFLPQNQTVSFYVVNQCPDGAGAIIPDTATLKRLNSTEQLTVPLSGTPPSSIGRIVQLFPSHIKWSNNPDCGS